MGRHTTTSTSSRYCRGGGHMRQQHWRHGVFGGEQKVGDATPTAVQRVVAVRDEAILRWWCVLRRGQCTPTTYPSGATPA